MARRGGENYYEVLGLHLSASSAEIRRAYRILARRYHPDLNPGRSSEDKFKAIAEAYETLSDVDKRTRYDKTIDEQRISRGFQNYERAQQAAAQSAARQRFEQRKYQNFGKGGREPEPEPQPVAKSTDRRSRRGSWGFAKIFDETVAIVRDKVAPRGRQRREPAETKTGASPVESSVRKISLIEVSVSIRDAIYGVKKAVEISEPEGTRKISVRIPAGVRNGSVVRLRGKSEPPEDIVLILRVATHPFLSIQPRGLIAEIPVTISEALLGASISVPTLEEPMIIKIPPGSQSGHEIRIKQKGAFQRDGARGDLFIRLLIHVPASPEAVGIRERIQSLEEYYGGAVRASMPSTLIE